MRAVSVLPIRAHARNEGDSRVGDKTQTETKPRISFRAVESLAKMGRLCHELSESMSGKLGQVFREIATAIAKYQEDEKQGGDLEVTMKDRVAFWSVSLAKGTLPEEPAPTLVKRGKRDEKVSTFVRVDRRQIETLLAFSQLFVGEESLLPWNGPGIAEAVRGLPLNLIGDEKAQKSALSEMEICTRLRGISQAFLVAVEETKELDLQ